MSLDDVDVRLIEAGDAPTRFARGWHCLGLTKDLGDGKPHSINAFGQKLVVFRGEDGQLNVLDSYCRHMGGDLSQGTVKGNEIACPFHDWRWGGDGKCKLVPYAKRTPRLARTAKWPTLEQDGMLFIWNDPEGSAPPEENYIPRIEQAGSDEWTDWHWYTTVVNVNCREIIDNVVDMAHFFYIHGSVPSHFKNIFEGHIATQVMDSTPRDDIVVSTFHDPTSILYSEASYFGPSYMIDRLRSVANGMTVETILINSHYPVSPNSFVLQYGAIVKKLPIMSEEENAELARTFIEGVQTGFEQDVEIWKHKARIDNPLLTEEDGPVYQHRRWYEQFYVDIEDVTPDMTDRFEFEIDTTHSIESWEAEVADNLAAAAES